MPTPFEIVKGIPFHRSRKTDFKTNTSTRYIAAEIEIDNFRNGRAQLTAAASRWQAALVHDGSIPSGIEVNTAPANGDLYVQQIRELCAAASLDRGAVSSACGLHVHLDCRDFSYYDLRRLVFTYEAVEDALYAMQPSNRRTNSYCTPCGPILGRAIRSSRLPKVSKYMLTSGIYGTPNPGELKTQKYAGNRYFAMNLHSWFFRGTTEIRIHSGTINPKKIINWSRIILAMVDYAKSCTEAQSLKLQHMLPIEALKFIVANDELNAYIDRRVAQFSGGRRLDQEQEGSVDPEAEPLPEPPPPAPRPNGWRAVTPRDPLLPATFGQMPAISDDPF